MSSFLNLDKLIPPDKRVQLGGKEWVIPAQTPVGIMLKILRSHEKMSSGSDEMDPVAFQEALTCIWEMFKIKQPDLTLEQFESMVTAEQATQLLFFIVDGGSESAGVGQEAEQIEKKLNGSDANGVAKAQPT